MAGVSDRARRKLSRSGSAGSTEHAPDEPLSNAHSSPAGTRRKAPDRPPPPGAKQPPGRPAQGPGNDAAPHSGPVGNSNFFQTLEWQDQHETLMDDTSDDDGHRPRHDSTEDEFAALSSQRVNVNDFVAMSGPSANNNQDTGPDKAANFFDAEFGDAHTTPGEPVVDLLNMGAESSAAPDELAAGVDLMDIKPEPSTLELLTGMAEPEPMGNLLGDGFDFLGPAQSGGSDRSTPDPFPTQAPSQVPVSNNLGDFDLFQSAAGADSMTGSFHSDNKPSAVPDDDFLGFMDSSMPSSGPDLIPNKPSDFMSSSGPDLMGDWGAAPAKSGMGNAAQSGMGGAGLHATTTTKGGTTPTSPDFGNQPPPPKTKGDPFADLGEYSNIPTSCSLMLHGFILEQGHGENPLFSIKIGKQMWNIGHI